MENNNLDAIYTLDGKISLLKAFPFGLQHILAMLQLFLIYFYQKINPITSGYDFVIAYYLYLLYNRLIFRKVGLFFHRNARQMQDN